MIKKILVLLALVSSIQGCVFIAGAAVGAAGVAVVYDHRTLEKISLDQNIANQASAAINAVPDLRQNTHISVNCFNQMVLLTGQVNTAEERNQIERIVKRVPDVTKVYNQISVGEPTSTTTRTKDSWITAKIKTQMLATKELQSGEIKVVTENGIVYLMGYVSRFQADMAVEIARHTEGVQQVIRVFQYKKSVVAVADAL